MGSTTHKKGAGYRRLNQMNGDYLTLLKEPKRSEMNSIVVGTNKAITTLMNKRLDLYYKDKNIAMEKIRRKQDAVYGTMLRVQREKKILQRAVYKRRQEEGRIMNTKSMDRIDVSVAIQNENKVEDIEYKEEVKHAEHSKDIEHTGHQEELTHKSTGAVQGEDIPVSTNDVSQDEVVVVPKREKTFERKSKVLEVRKKAPLAPITRERSDLTSEVMTTNELRHDYVIGGLSALPDIRPELSPERRIGSNEPGVQKEPSITDMVIDSVAGAQTGESFLKSQHGGSRRLSKSTVAMPTISEKELNRNIPTRHSDELLYDNEKRRKTRKLKTTETRMRRVVVPCAFEQECDVSNSISAHSDSNNSVDREDMAKRKAMSLVERNKRRAREKLRKQHNLLQKETVKIYIKDSKGRYVLSNTEFKRRQFKAPSMKEKHFQEKMLREEVEARLDQRNRLEEFFERMAHEERERQRIRDAYNRQAKEEADTERRKLKEADEQLGFSTAQMATLFSKGILPEGIDPGSFEAIKYCKYIRNYSPKTIEAARHKAAIEGKTSSWDAIVKLRQKQS